MVEDNGEVKNISVSETIEISEYFHKILNDAVSLGAKELLLIPGKPVSMKKEGSSQPQYGEYEMSVNKAIKIVFWLMTSEQREVFKKRNYFKLLYRVPELGKFVVTLFMSSNKIVLFIRPLRKDMESIDSYPGMLKKMIEASRHKLILLFGDENSTRMCNAAVGYINETMAGKLLILSKTVGYELPPGKADAMVMVKGEDIEDLRQLNPILFDVNPDIVFLDEAIDYEAMQSALLYSAQSLLMFINMRAASAVSAISRLINTFPPYQHRFVRDILVSGLSAAFGVKEVISKEGVCIPIFETMVMSNEIKEIMLTGDITNIERVIEKNELGMGSFDQHLDALIANGTIELAEAFRSCSDKERFMSKYKEGFDGY